MLHNCSIVMINQKGKTMGFSETTVVYDIKVGRCSYSGSADYFVQNGVFVQFSYRFRIVFESYRFMPFEGKNSV